VQPAPSLPAAAPVPQPPAGPAAVAPAPSAPAANPYGSFVSAAEPSYPQAAPSHLDGPGYHSGYAAGQQAVAAGGWYNNLAPDAGQTANGYLPAPAPGLNGTGTNGANSTGTNGTGGRHGYPPIDYSNLTYSDSVYPDLPSAGHQQALAGYGHATPGEQRGYPADAVYGQDGYPGYPGYGNGR